jgi:pimeloyl-ACP methyl ester carboxylesterase
MLTGARYLRRAAAESPASRCPELARRRTVFVGALGAMTAMRALAASLLVVLATTSTGCLSSHAIRKVDDRPTPYETDLHGQWGRIHVRVDGPGSGPIVILVHQFPMSLAQFRLVQPLLAEKGIRSIAFDIPGFGGSDPPPFPPDHIPSAEQYAQTLSSVYDYWGIRSASLVGTNTGASLITAYADAHPRRVHRMVIDGPPIFTRGESADLIVKNRPTDVSSTSKAWYAHEAIYKYDMESAVRRLKVPLLIIAYPGQVLYKASLALKNARPDFELRTLTSTAMVASLDQAQQWTDTVASYVVDGH